MSKSAARKFLTLEQVAEELNVGIPQIRALVRSGDLRAFQVGGRGLWRVSTIDLENYILHAYEVTAKRIATGQVEQESGTSEDEPSP